MNEMMKLAMEGQDDVCAEYAAVSVGTIEAHGSRYVTFNAPSGWFGRNSFINPSAEELDGIVKEILANAEKGYPALTAYAEEFQPDNFLKMSHGSKRLFSFSDADRNGV